MESDSPLMGALIATSAKEGMIIIEKQWTRLNDDDNDGRIIL